MVALQKLAYYSALNYGRIIVDTLITINKGQTVLVPLPEGLVEVPYVRIWGELFDGEFSSVFNQSAQYSFSFAYFDAFLDGYDVSMTDKHIQITSLTAGTKRVYVRAYA